MNDQVHNLRPREFALLLLASCNAAPRQRARDQQPDRLGLSLKRRVLTHLLEMDPESNELECCLATIIEQLGEPTGPTRAIALGILDEWNSIRTAPEWESYLLKSAREAAEYEGHRSGRQLPG